MILLFMIASLASGGMALLLALSIGGLMLIISAPGFIVGAFFAFRYAMFDRSKAKQEEHRHNRDRRKH
jgi:hypothetical protein